MDLSPVGTAEIPTHVLRRLTIMNNSNAGLKRPCRKLCRPYGTRSYFRFYLALKRWTKLSGIASGDALSWSRPSLTLPMPASWSPRTRRRGPLLQQPITSRWNFWGTQYWVSWSAGNFSSAFPNTRKENSPSYARTWLAHATCFVRRGNWGSDNTFAWGKVRNGAADAARLRCWWIPWRPS